MNNYDIFGYLGIIFAMIYRFPQIFKIYKSKQGGDISKKTFILHNFAYLFFLLYVGYKRPIDYLLISYYIIGIIQNLSIVLMKYYYKEDIEV